MKISTKLILAFSIVATIPLVGGAIGILSYRSAVAREAKTIAEITFDSQAALTAREAQLAFKTQVQEWKNLLLRGHDAAAYAKHLEGFTKQETATQSALKALKSDLAGIPAEAVPIDTLLQAHAELGAKYRAALKEFKVDDPATSAVVDHAVNGIDRSPTEQFTALAQSWQERISATTDQAQERRESESRTRQWIMLVGTILGIALGVTFGITLSLGVARYIRGVADRMWNGSEQVSAAATQVAGASQELAAASSQQAASLEETSAALEEISGIIKQNAENARDAQELSNANRQAADAGSGEMTAMLSAMNEISAASSNIAKIVKSIDEIAFQTNILALNAAVEAARAGEAGAGFAVVAEEVRNLAQRSAQAAKETETMIANAIQKSENGVRISGRIGDTLKQILDNAHKVDDLIGQIASASNEQAKGIENVNQSMLQIDQLTQRNAASSEETASASKELESHAAHLQEELSRLTDRGAAGAAHAETHSTASPAPQRQAKLAPAGAH